MSDREQERRLLDAVSGSRLMAATAAIARWVRLSGEPDELAAFEWIEQRMRAAGYRTELSHHRAYISLPGPASVRAEGGTPVTGISHAFAAPTPEAGLTARLADAADRPEDVAGAIVLVDGMASGVTVRTWEGRGALGQIHVHDDHLHETGVSPVWGNPTDEGLALMPRTPSLAIRKGDAARLRERLAAGTLDVTIATEVSTEWRPIPLLVADLEGAPRAPFLLLSTHVDSWHYGAMDNGSANATTIEVAELLAPLAAEVKRGLRVAFWSGHSHGRFAGSAWFADEHWHELHDGCVAHVFVDSTGGMGANIVTEPPVMPQTSGLAASVVHDVTGEAFEGKRIGRFADQSFYAVGLNSIFGTLSEQDASAAGDGISFKTGGRRAGGLGWWWHTPDDTVDKVDEANLVRDTRIYLAAVHRLLTAQRLPFDYRPAMTEILDTLVPRLERARAHLDLSALARDLERTQGAVTALHDAMDGWGSEHDGLANEVLTRLSRHLVPIAFHERGRFERDLAEPLVPVPSLKDLDRLAGLAADDPSADAIATRLHRTANWVRAEARAATALAERALAEAGAA
jgi:hypothetical protein